MTGYCQVGSAARDIKKYRSKVNLNEFSAGQIEAKIKDVKEAIPFLGKENVFYGR
jgi:hypothetical protein